MNRGRRGRLTLARLLPVLALVGSAGCSSHRPGPLSPVGGDRFFVAGYHPYWAGAAWESYPWNDLDQLYFFELEVGADGRIADPHGWPEEWSQLAARARDAGVSLVPTISMHDAEAFEELFRRPESVTRLVEVLVGLLASTRGLGGLHLDFEVFEPVHIAARDGYTAFVARLARRMDELDPSLSLSLFTLAFDDDDVYNEGALAELADFLVVQGYDFHHATDERSGPLAALEGWDRLNWTSVLERFLALGVGAHEIVMAVPLYGYEWPVATAQPGSETRGEAVIIPLAPPPDVVPELPRARARASEHGLRRDPESDSPYYVYRDDSGWHQGWIEDAESLRAKYDFVREHRLGGVALFPLAYGDEAMWNDLRTAFSRPRG